MLLNYVKAGYPLIMAKTNETERFIDEQAANINGHSAFVWDLVRGLRKIGETTFTEADPFDIPQIIAKEEKAVFFLKNYHFHLDQPAIIQGLQNNLKYYKHGGTTAVIIAPDAKIPPELSRDIVTLDIPLPTREQLAATMQGLVMATDINPDDPEAILAAATGLTEQEAENAMALALVKTKGWDAKTIIDLKAKMIENTAGLKYAHYCETFDEYAGNENMFTWTSNRFAKHRPGLHFPRLLILGHPGCGKSHFVKACGNKFGIPVITWQPGESFGSLVGETERNVAEVFKAIRAMAPCILLIDEVEKGLAGVGGSSTDGGTTQRFGGIFLTEMDNLPDNISVMATCNNYNDLAAASNGAFVRMGRWDAMFFVGLPEKHEAEQILKIYLEKFEVKIDNPITPDLTGYSGAEIRQIAIEAAYNDADLIAAKAMVIPLSKSQKTQMEALEEWAKGRTVPATMPKAKTKKLREISL